MHVFWSRRCEMLHYLNSDILPMKNRQLISLINVGAVPSTHCRAAQTCIIHYNDFRSLVPFTERYIPVIRLKFISSTVYDRISKVNGKYHWKCRLDIRAAFEIIRHIVEIQHKKEIKLEEITQTQLSQGKRARRLSYKHKNEHQWVDSLNTGYFIW